MTNEEFFESISFDVDKVRADAYHEGYDKAHIENEFDPICLKNNCFSLANELPEDDERLDGFKQQRLDRGFDNSELWNLDCTILKFVLPRLKAFRETTCGHPGDITEEEWDEMLGKMIKSIEDILDDNIPDTEKNYEGFELFKERFFSLWD